MIIYKYMNCYFSCKLGQLRCIEIKVHKVCLNQMDQEYNLHLLSNYKCYYQRCILMKLNRRLHSVHTAVYFMGLLYSHTLLYKYKHFYWRCKPRQQDCMLHSINKPMICPQDLQCILHLRCNYKYYCQHCKFAKMNYNLPLRHKFIQFTMGFKHSFLNNYMYYYFDYRFEINYHKSF